jgi:hypothetical protein
MRIHIKGKEKFSVLFVLQLIGLAIALPLQVSAQTSSPFEPSKENLGKQWPRP